MKSKVITVLNIIVIVCLLSLGLVSCKSSSTEENDDVNGTNDVTNEDNHRDQMVTIATELGDAYYELDQLLTSPRVDDADWVYQVAILLADMMALCDQSWQVIPPDSITEVEFTFLEAISHFDDALDVIVQGINQESYDLITEASTEMWLASEILGQVTRLLEEADDS